MTTRVWRQLRTEAEATRDQDSVLRLALASMAADPTSALTRAQRQWVIELAHRTTRLTAEERGKLKTPLLAYITERMPRCEAIVRKQFQEEEA